MTKKQLRYAFNKVIEAAESLRCEQLHHTSKQQHEAGFVCKAEYELHKHCQAVRSFVKKELT